MPNTSRIANGFKVEVKQFTSQSKRPWLPAPAGGFEFAARFYGPATPVIDGRYDMPGVARAAYAA